MLRICFIDSRPLMESSIISQLTKQACSSACCCNLPRSALNNQTVIQPLLTFHFLRKEVIQPHLPIRLPCYDFTPVTRPAFGGFLLIGWITDFGHFRLPWCDGRCVQDPGTYSPRHSDSRLLAIPASCSRVADYNPNWDVIFGICSRSLLRFPLLRHCSTCVALVIRGMMI